MSRAFVLGSRWAMNIRGLGCLFRPGYRGRDGKLRKAGIWWWKVGKARMSTGCRDEKEAQKWVIARLTEMGRGHLLGRKSKPVSYDDLEAGLRARWELNGRKGYRQALSSLKHLRSAFAGWDVAAITTDRVDAYALRRRKAGAAVATVNLELSLLHRAFAVARRTGRVQEIPLIDRLKGTGHRTGTIERGDFEAILARLPARYVPLVRFLYLTGWREGEALGLTWDCIDDRDLYLPARLSKTAQPRRMPYSASPELVELLNGQRRERGFGPYVFPGRANRPMDRTALQKAWRRSCVAVGVPRALLHDIRRTVARDLRRAGVAPYVAMAQLGHKDARTHQDYSVVLPEDQAQAIARLSQYRASEPRRRSVARLP